MFTAHHYCLHDYPTPTAFPPDITNPDQPEDQLDIPRGQTVLFYIEASGSLLEYQWQRDGIDLTDEVKLSGTNTSNLTITDVLEEDGGNFTCIVSNILGNVTSRAAELTVCKLLNIITGGNNLESGGPLLS